MHHDALLILIAGLLLATGVAASLAATRIRLPALVVFLGIGMAIGTDGLGWIDFGDYELARSIGTVALVLILFEGGISTGLRQVRPVLRSAAVLAVGGTIVTALVPGSPRSGSSTCRPRKGCCSAPSCRRPTAPPSSRSCAGRTSPTRLTPGRSRRRRASTIPSRSCW